LHSRHILSTIMGMIYIINQQILFIYYRTIEKLGCWDGLYCGIIASETNCSFHWLGWPTRDMTCWTWQWSWWTVGFSHIIRFKSDKILYTKNNFIHIFFYFLNSIYNFKTRSLHSNTSLFCSGIFVLCTIIRHYILWYYLVCINNCSYFVMEWRIFQMHDNHF